MKGRLSFLLLIAKWRLFHESATQIHIYNLLIDMLRKKEVNTCTCVDNIYISAFGFISHAQVNG